MAAEAEQAGPLGAQGGHPGEQRPGVGVPAQAAGHGGLVETAAHVAVLQRGQRGLRGGQHERDEPAVEAPVVGGGAGRGQGVGAEPGGLGLVGEVERRRVGRVGHQGVEALRERGQLGVDLAEALLAGLRQGGARRGRSRGGSARAGESRRRPGRGPPGARAGRRPGRRAARRGRGRRSARPAAGANSASTARTPGVAWALARAPRHRLDAVQQPAAALQGEHGVLEGRLAGLRGHGLPLGPLLRDPGRHRRAPGAPRGSGRTAAARRAACWAPRTGCPRRGRERGAVRPGRGREWSRGPP